MTSATIPTSINDGQAAHFVRLVPPRPARSVGSLPCVYLGFSSAGRILSAIEDDGRDFAAILRRLLIIPNSNLERGIAHYVRVVGPVTPAGAPRNTYLAFSHMGKIISSFNDDGRGIESIQPPHLQLVLVVDVEISAREHRFWSTWSPRQTEVGKDNIVDIQVSARERSFWARWNPNHTRVEYRGRE